jgi:hypothetical protein
MPAFTLFGAGIRQPDIGEYDERTGWRIEYAS